MKRLFRNATLINEGRSFTASLLTSGALIERIYEGENSFPEGLLSEVDEVIPAEGLCSYQAASMISALPRAWAHAQGHDRE